MKRLTSKRTGLIILLGYLGIVVALEVLGALLGWPIERWLASSPNQLAAGQWWRLFTSALVIDGSPAPQILITALLGGLIIWLRGSGLFWGIASAAHVLATLITYFVVLWVGSAEVHHFMSAPDFGISLIWSSALGVLAAAAWLGPSPSWREAYRPYVTLGAFAVMVVVIALSAGDDALQHALAFVIGAGLLMMIDKTGSVSRHTAIRRAH